MKLSNKTVTDGYVIAWEAANKYNYPALHTGRWDYEHFYLTSNNYNVEHYVAPPQVTGDNNTYQTVASFNHLFKSLDFDEILAQAKLTDQEIAVIHYIFVDEKIQEEIAAILEVSQPRVAQIKKRGLEKLTVAAKSL